MLNPDWFSFIRHYLHQFEWLEPKGEFQNLSSIEPRILQKSHIFLKVTCGKQVVCMWFVAWRLDLSYDKGTLDLWTCYLSLSYMWDMDWKWLSRPHKKGLHIHLDPTKQKDVWRKLSVKTVVHNRMLLKTFWNNWKHSRVMTSSSTWLEYL